MWADTAYVQSEQEESSRYHITDDQREIADHYVSDRCNADLLNQD